MTMTPSGRHIEIRGTVQGVGFRPWVYQLAHATGVAGRVRNDSKGVIIDAYGSADAVDRFVHALESGAPPAARVRSIEWNSIPYQAASEFAIDASAESAELQVSIPADLATCDECLSEVLDPANRRYRYAFTNCTNCGPRYSIVTGSPYDRPKTSMARFEMCAQCQREYDDPLNRRFHAQPNACPVCGPRLVAMTGQHQEVSTSDPIGFAARAIRAGLIVAVKGIGGFHLACDARSVQAVQRLRERKRREAKPLAVMVRDLEDAEAIAELTASEEKLLVSVERPIVLARARAESILTKDVSNDGNVVGLFLPYTPLHHLLSRDAGVPLVMTSGNLSDEPMVTTNADALDQLGAVADLFLLHDRDIVPRADDSVVRIIAGAPAILRRSRGYVPRSIETTREFAEPILACGAQLKNTFCIAAGSRAFPGPHIGDLDSLQTMHDYETAITQMTQFVGVTPRVLAHDLHPDYLSTRYARGQENVRTVGVQHHHAHVASVMAECGLDGPVVGIAYDGTGYGTDGTAWGGEILVATYEDFQRFATFRPIPLAGGDQAIRQPWRIALALLDEAFDGEPPLDVIPLFESVPAPAIAAARRMIATQFNTPLARGVGRLFDAFGSFILGLADARYEGEIAIRWNLAADDREHWRYPIIVHEDVTPWEIDPRSTVKAAIDDLVAGRSAATISARFHNTIAAATIEVARAAGSSHRDMPVVLSGGCFQNARLAESIIDSLRPTSRVFMNREVPAGDGGIALGQAFIANALLQRTQVKRVEQKEPVCV